MHFRAFVRRSYSPVSASLLLLCGCTATKPAPVNPVQPPFRQVIDPAAELAGCWQVTNNLNNQSSRHEFDSVSVIRLDTLVLESEPQLHVYSAQIYSGARPVWRPEWFQRPGSDSIIVRVNPSRGWSFKAENGQLVGLVELWSKWIEPPTSLVAHLGYARAVRVSCPSVE
jgi:hypothetical protein